MADSTIDSELVQLVFNQWGPTVRNGWIPPDGFIGASHHNVSAAVYEKGMSVVVYQDGVAAGTPGYVEFTYLQVGTQNASNLLAAKDLCTQDSATVWYQVTNDPNDCVLTEGGLAAYCMTAMTDAYYGWFWTGGVSPEDPKFFNGVTSLMVGNYVTDGTAVAGSKNIVSDASNDLLAIGVGGTDELITIKLLAADA